jgi:hypothetical protein
METSLASPIEMSRSSVCVTRCVPYSVGDCPGGAGNANLTDTFDAQCIHVWVGLLDQDGLERRHVGVHRHVVFGDLRERSPGTLPMS